MSKPPISVFIITLNEADRLACTVEAVRPLSDDIVIIDSGSTDGTEVLGRELGCRVIHNDWPGYGPQKRFGEEQCRNDWLLNIDADEVLTPDAVTEIAELFQTGTPANPGYLLKVVTVYPGQAKPRPLADYYTINRLYDRRVMRYSKSLTDDRVLHGEAALGAIASPIWHYSFRSLDDILPKLESYAHQQVHEKAGRRKIWNLRIRRLFEYPLQLFRYLIGRRHITGGWTGMRYAHLLARSKVRRLEIFMNHKRNVPGP